MSSVRLLSQRRVDVNVLVVENLSDGVGSGSLIIGKNVCVEIITFPIEDKNVEGK